MDMCVKCTGICKLVTGALLLLNAFVWPRWWGIDGWVAWVSVLMVLGGVLLLVMPRCPHCCSVGKAMPMPASKPMKKR